MTVIRNQRDKLLRLSGPRVLNPPSAKIILFANPNAFVVNDEGVATPDHITLVPELFGLSGTVNYTALGATVTRIGQSNNGRVNYSSMTADTAVVTASITANGQTFSNSISLLTIYDRASVDVDSISEELLGRITEQHLIDALRGRINLIDGSPDLGGSVANRIRAETNARVAALDTAMAAEVAARDAFVKNYAYSKAQSNDSEALQTFNITTAYTSYVDGQTGAVLSNAQAYVRGYSYSKTDSDSALSTMATNLRAEFSSNNGASVAYVQEYTYSKAQADSAIASSTQTLSSRVGNNETAIQTQIQTTDGLKAQYTVKIDNNGYVTGYGLASSYVNGVPTSAFVVNAGRFAVVAPGVAPRYMFTVGTMNGQTNIGLHGDTIIDGTLKARHLSIMGSSDNLIRDPQFKDLVYWGRAAMGAYVGDWTTAGFNTAWKGGASLYLGPGVHYQRDSDTPYFNLEPGATYRIDYQISVTADFNGLASVFLLLPASAWYSMSGVWSRRGNWEDGLSIDVSPADAGQLLTFSHMVTVANDSRNSRGLIRIRDRYSTGNVEIGAMSITRVVDETLIGPGVVQTKHLIIAKGGAINSGQWGYGQGNGFWLEGQGNGHGARFSVGNSGGKQFLCDPDNNVLGLYGVNISNPAITSNFAVSIDAIDSLGNPSHTDAYLGAGAYITAGSGNYDYLWSFTSNGPFLSLVSGPSEPSATIRSNAGDGWRYGYLTLTIRDRNTGMQSSDTQQVRVQMGYGVEP